MILCVPSTFSDNDSSPYPLHHTPHSQLLPTSVSQPLLPRQLSRSSSAHSSQHNSNQASRTNSPTRHIVNSSEVDETERKKLELLHILFDPILQKRREHRSHSAIQHRINLLPSIFCLAIS